MMSRRTDKPWKNWRMKLEDVEWWERSKGEETPKLNIHHRFWKHTFMQIYSLLFFHFATFKYTCGQFDASTKSPLRSVDNSTLSATNSYKLHKGHVNIKVT